jgi:hypothetical protein
MPYETLVHYEANESMNLCALGTNCRICYPVDSANLRGTDLSIRQNDERSEINGFFVSQETAPMPNRPPEVVMPEESPESVKRASEPTPENPETILLSAKLTRNAAGLTLILRSPILENFFKVLSNGQTYSAGVVRRWKVPNPQILNSYDTTGSIRWSYPSTATPSWIVDSGQLNLQILTTVGLGSGVNLISDIPMTKDMMKTLLENLKSAAKEIYLSFCTPVEGEVSLTVKEKLSTGSQEIAGL